MRITTSRFAACVLAAVISTARADPSSLNLVVQLSHSDGNILSASTQDWSSQPYVTSRVPGFLTSFRIDCPSGDYSVGESGLTLFHSNSTGSLEELKAAMAHVPWTLNVTTTLGTSTYAITPDLSQLTLSTFPALRPTNVQPGQYLPPTPSFDWTPAFAGGAAYVLTPQFSQIDYSTIYVGSATWTPAATLPDGQYVLQLTQGFYVPAGDIPLELALLSGPDQGAFTSSLLYQYASYTPFAVPEPGIALAAAGAIFLKTGRNRVTRRS